MGGPQKIQWMVYIDPIGHVYMESLEGDSASSSMRSPLQPFPGQLVVMAGPGKMVLKSPSAGGSPANMARAQLYPRCSGRGSAPLSFMSLPVD